MIIVSGLDSSFPIALSSLFDISSLPDKFLFFNLLIMDKIYDSLMVENINLCGVGLLR